MDYEKYVIRGLLRHYWKKGLSAVAATKEICEVEGEGAVGQRVSQNWFRRFKSGDTSLQDKDRSGRPSLTDDEALCEAVLQEPGTTTRNLCAEFHVSQTTIVRHLHQLGFRNRRPQLVPHELTTEHAQNRLDVCKKLLTNPRDLRFWRRIITGDEKWIFYRNPNNNNQWLQPKQEGETVVRKGRFEHKVMLSIWWNFEGPIHWELVPEGQTVNGDLYAQQLERVYEILQSRYPSLINRKRALLQHDNAPAHRSKVVKSKLKELDGFEVISHPPYSPDLAPSDYHLFRSMASFLKGRRFLSAKQVADGVREFLQSKPPEWYRRGIEILAERWTKTIEHDGLYFME